MSTAVILQHVEHEGPGRIEQVFRDFGIPVQLRRLDRGDEVPTAIDGIRVLVVMGGPMGVVDIGDARYPFLKHEVTLLQRMMDHDRAVLGICLGAQLLAHAAGAKVYAAPTPEIGWAPVSFPFPGGTEPIVQGVHDGMMVFHWHFDTFDLPKLPPPANPLPGPPQPGSVLLSSTKSVKNQAFRLKNRLFGFQYHFEMDRAGIEAMLVHGEDDWQKVLGADGDRRIRQDTELLYMQYERLGNRILRNFVQYLKLY